MNKTLRDLRTALLDALQSESACSIHLVPDTNIALGKTDADTGFVAPAIIIRAYPKTRENAENSGGAKIAEIDVWCLAKATGDVAQTEMDAIELCERASFVLNNPKLKFCWISESEAQIDFSYTDYSSAVVTFTHAYIPSIL